MRHAQIIRNVAIAAAVLLAPAAFAGAPGPDAPTEKTEVQAQLQTETRATLSPAELRNAVTVQLDQLAEQGIEIDRAAYEGIGLKWAARSEPVELFTEARLLAPRLEDRAP